jgi:flagellin
MPIGFRSNILATNTIGAMERSSTQLSRVNQRLSSGMRINSASDDPAGLSAAMRLGTDARVANRASRNINDGISALQIADGGYESASSVIARFGELASMAASGSLSNTQRAALNQEVGALRGELLRIRSSLSFNGRELLTGEAVNVNGSTILSSVSGAPQVSADGRYVTYINTGGSLIQLDTQSGVSNRIASGVSQFAVSSQGDYVAYFGSGRVNLYDRVANSTQNYLTLAGVDLLAVSDNGEKVAFVSRIAYSPTGTSLGNLGDRNITIITSATGAVNGDNGSNAFTSYSSLAITADGSRVALVGSSGAIYNARSAYVDSDVASPIYSGIVATKVAFDATNDLIFSSASDVGGLNGSGIANVYRLDDETTFSQITNIRSGSGVTNFFVTDNGNSVTLASASTTLGENPSGYSQIYKADLSGNIAQRSKFTGTFMNNLSTVSGDGNSVYTASGGTIQQYNVLAEANFQIETGTGASGVLNSPIRALDSAIRALYYWDVSTQRNARLSVDIAAGNVEQLASARGVLGSALARLETAFRATDAKATELTAARSRIQDVDVAAEVAEQTRLSILGNTQVSLLSSASKLVPEIALQLLKSAGGDIRL